MPEKARSQNRETAPELQAILDSSEVARHDARRTMAEVIVSQSILGITAFSTSTNLPEDGS